MTGSFRKLLAAKIHRATVTGADVDYEGSVTVPPELLQAAGIHPYESVHIWNVTRGTRLETYAIAGRPGSNDVCANGAAAHLVRPGDQVILASYLMVAEDQVADHRPKLIFVDHRNRIVHRGPEVAGPQIRDETQERSETQRRVEVEVSGEDNHYRQLNRSLAAPSDAASSDAASSDAASSDAGSPA